MTYRSDQYDTMDLDDVEEALADRPRDEKWELIGGRVVKMMMGARWERHRIIQDLNLAISHRLRERGSDCRVFTETFYMKSRAVESATLPDVIVHRGPLPPGATSLDDPKVLVDVVSKGSEARDRHDKWRVYRWLASLQHDVLVSRDEATIDAFDRADKAWASLRTLEGLGSTLDLPALGLAVPLADIDRDVLTA